MKSHLLLLQAVLTDVGTQCCTSTIKDFETILEREKHEGLSFLTITLPQLCKDFERSLDIGYVDPSLFTSFVKRGRLPRFLGGFFDLVFDRTSGELFNQPSVDAIWAIRQVCNLFSKLEFPCSDTRTKAAITRYVECDAEVRRNDTLLSDADRDRFRRMSLLLWTRVFSPMDEIIHNGDMIPKHGPGSTAERLLGNQKFNQVEWTERLEDFFPHGEFMFSNWRNFNARDVVLHALEQERPVRVITVPKTLKTPRIIAIEPTCMQYVQQGIMEMCVHFIGEHSVLNEMVGFKDQVINNDMAREGSLYGTFATLDLSEASDRVSNLHVEDLLWAWPSLFGGVQACRSRHADVPGHGIIPLSKFASMGSALCFPFEAMVFLTVVMLGIERAQLTPMTLRRLSSLRGQVRVYGDDIIVPMDYVHSVRVALKTFGFEVNTTKSFWTGKFRESCGKEYYDGHDVSVVKVRHGLPGSRMHKREIVATVDLRNQLYWAGCWEAAAFLDKLLARFIPMPRVLPTSPGKGRHSVLGYESQRECVNLQRPLVKALVVAPKIPADKLEDDGALLKYFLKRGSEPYADEKHLERAGRPDAVNTKLRWVPPY